MHINQHLSFSVFRYKVKNLIDFYVLPGWVIIDIFFVHEE